jgi:ArsR family transcriptional regulator, arsenate/arsenite/antimonite-responsive transcriptional repressor / arsenate reductase (thioredoxin)
MPAEMDVETTPAVFRLSGHPVRWRLLQKLVASDRQVRELSRLVDERQSLTSYHLGQLRKGGLVSARRSAADGRDTYYSLDLPACRDALVEAGAALHPGLRLVRPPSSSGRTGARPGASGPVTKVLFLCTGNSARSQMAQALVETMAGPRVRACSAGSSPKGLHPSAVRVMRARGIDISGRRPKRVDEFADEHFDFVITLCDRVREVCPEFDGSPITSHWSMPDPAAEVGDGPDDAPFIRTADELTTRIDFLLHRIESHVSAVHTLSPVG